MAQSKSTNKSGNTTRKRSASSSASSRKNNGSRSTQNRSNSRSNTTKKSSVKSAEVAEPSFSYFLNIYKTNRIFKTLIHIAIIVIIVLLDLLFAWNNYERFFTILGIELLIIAIISVFILFFAINDGNNSDSGK